MIFFEFHISRQSRDKYAFDDTLFGLNGNVLFANFRAARAFAQKMNTQRDLANHPERANAVRAGQINAMGLIDEMLHVVAAQYRQQVNPPAMQNALAWLNAALGADAVDNALKKFADEFPSVAVYRGEIDAAKFLDDSTGGVPHRQIILEEMLMLWLANVNLAFAPFRELFDDASLKNTTAYPLLITNLYAFFETQPRYGPDHQNLIDLLRAPAIASPHSLEGQLEFMRTRWVELIGEQLARLLGSLDLIKEENKVVFPGSGEAQVPTFKRGGLGMGDGESERFSRDLDWMPQVVLIAKSTYVWLDQLSKKYQRAITRLDQIPDEELDLLAHRGFTGLWLIGLWQRSAASRRIKELCGAPNAESSAYSIAAYRIAEDLGGDAALENLKTRAWARGIRLASDMVPNHMGIDSPWVVEHPDWFVQSEDSPFPAYTFNGPNLSPDHRVGIYLEDHYFNRADAAVVFKRIDHWTGETKYIYHGNDGTSFPWNDTAQLNFLNPAAREAVIQTILHVARQFPIIRLDAAMTLAKKHFQRLWFPQPGMGGDIPSRADFGLTIEQFNAAMPAEFWREVVDRVAAEAPDTLLLAEAFWLMEGYFVRTLGMHRVYNSAFMNMLRDEKNANYRSVIKNTLEFDPEILKRYVNFINNPDEKTAVDQFGKGDKYFGVATLMATLPGLPMFGHGQVEGFAERYGMEFRRAMWDEPIDVHLVERHAREIFPLLHRRRVFAGVENFLLYDFFTPDGVVNEDVFAFSNRIGDERGLVVYHNKFANTAGWIRGSAAYLDKRSGQLAQKNLGEGLALHHDADYFVIFRDPVSGLEFIRHSPELFEKGLYAELNAYQRHVFIDFRETPDDSQHQYARLTALLNGQGVPSIDEALREMHLQPVHQPFRELMNANTLRQLMEARSRKGDPRGRPARGRTQSASQQSILDAIETKFLHFARAAKHFSGGTGDAIALAKQTRREIEILLQLPTMRASRVQGFAPALKFMQAQMKTDAAWATMFGWIFVHALAQVQGDGDWVRRSRDWIDEWQLGKLIAPALQDDGMSEAQAGQAVAVIKLMTTHQLWFKSRDRRRSQAGLLLDQWLNDDETRQFLQINRFNDQLWVHKESSEALIGAMFAVAFVALNAKPKEIVKAHTAATTLLKAEKKSKYQLDKMLAALKSDPSKTENEKD